MNKNFRSNAGTKIKPLHSKVLIKLDLLEEKTDGGIILTANIQQKYAINHGYVMAMGDTASEYDSSLQVGDHVLFDEYHNENCGEEGYILIDAKHIWLKID